MPAKSLTELISNFLLSLIEFNNKDSILFSPIFENSISCYTGDGCGKCGACTDRILAFEKAGIEDVTIYKEDINE